MYEIFARTIKEKGLTAYAVSKATGVGQDVFSRWKSGTTKPSVENLQVVAKYLGVSMEYLLTGETSRISDTSDGTIKNAPANAEGVKDELIAYYGKTKEYLTEDDIDDVMAIMKAKAERNREKLANEGHD